MRILFGLTVIAFASTACGGSGSISYNEIGSTSSGSSGGLRLTTTSSSGTSGAASAATVTVASSSSGAVATNGSGSTGGSLCQSQACVVYASSNTQLYQVDPAHPMNAPTLLCPFGGALSSSDTVTDIAVVSQGTLYAITETALYTVNPTTCAATKVSSLSTSSEKFVGLAFTYNGVLVGADENGNVYTIDPSTGAVATVGTFGSNMGCSGDIVAISPSTELTQGAIYATAVPLSGASGNDQLVSLDPTTFKETLIGDTGFKEIFGLGYWGAQLYGFTHAGQVIQINPMTGAGTLLSSTASGDFSGGATTPLAPQTTIWQ